MNIETKEFVILNSNVSIYRKINISKYRNILKQLSTCRNKCLYLETMWAGLQTAYYYVRVEQEN